MHDITGDRAEVMKLLDDTIRQLGSDTTETRKAGAAALGLRSPKQWATQRDQIVDALKRGYTHEQPKQAVRAAGLRTPRGPVVVPGERAVQAAYAPRERTVALFQAAMDEYLEEKFGPGEPPPRRATKGATARSMARRAKVATRPTRAAFYRPQGARKAKGKAAAAALVTQFSSLDPRWIKVVTEKAKLLFQGKRPFIAHRSVGDFRFEMADDATVAITGDWGGGNEAAQAVAAQIKRLDPDHVIHLGDVYYAGTPNEVQNRFLKYWPAPTKAGRSFALNSNHEMYSGGYGYFDLTLKTFKQPASYFSLANPNWRFIGLDTGYVDHDLNAEQAAWLTAQFSGKFPKTILLSHHQLFSAYEQTDTSHLQGRVQPFLDANQIDGWFWGHEHLNVVYGDHLGIKARCLGNSCFPYDPPAKAKSQVPIKWINTRLQTNTSSWRGIHSYAVLRFRAASVDIEYVDQDGTVGFKETWA